MIVERWVKDLPFKTINVGGKPYLTRYYLKGDDKKRALGLLSNIEPPEGFRDKGNLYVHHFHSSDQGDELHSHPWDWGISIVISGGYWEDRATNPETWSQPQVPDIATDLLNAFREQPVKVQRRKVGPGSINFIKSSHFHRVDLLDETNGAWSLFLAGPRRKDWGFLNRHTSEYTDYRLNPEAIP